MLTLMHGCTSDQQRVPNYRRVRAYTNCMSFILNPLARIKQLVDETCRAVDARLPVVDSSRAYCDACSVITWIHLADVPSLICYTRQPSGGRNGDRSMTISCWRIRNVSLLIYTHHWSTLDVDASAVLCNTAL